MITIQGLYKKYGDFCALTGLDMHIEKGEFFGFVGPNGAGKTTTVKIITGLLAADGGELYVDGVNALTDHQRLTDKIGYVPDFFGVYDNLKVKEYLEFFASIYRIEGKSAAMLIGELLERVGLQGTTGYMVDELSRGMKQRLCLARAMIHNPQLLVLDEPASGLDPRTRHDFKKTLKELCSQGMTILLSSHILTEVAAMCTSIGIIEKGKIILQGSIDDVLNTVDTSNPLKITVYNNLDKTVHILKRCIHIRKLSMQGNIILTEFTGSKEEESLLLKELIQNDILVTSFAREQSSLEALFLKITQVDDAEVYVEK